MFTHIRSTHVFVVAGLLCVSTGVAFGADNRPIDQSIPILTPDDPNSIATIVLPGDEPTQVDVRVVRLSDASVASLLVPDGRDPAAPARIAKIIFTEGGPVQVNVVEVDRQELDASGRRGSRWNVRWVVNTDRPFTVQAEIQAALEGRSIVQPRPMTEEWRPDAVCYVTGAWIVELFVWHDSLADRQVRPNYGIQIVTPGEPGWETAGTTSTTGGQGGLDGGDEDGGDDDDDPPPGEGSDPIGSPDRAPRQG